MPSPIVHGDLLLITSAAREHLHFCLAGGGGGGQVTLRCLQGSLLLQDKDQNPPVQGTALLSVYSTTISVRGGLLG